MMSFRLVSQFSLTLALCASLMMGQRHPSSADPQSVAPAQKALALRLFAKDANVSAAIKTLQDSKYKLLSTDALPYRFSFGDEGPHTAFLVTAWLGKTATYGWTSAFVTAKVTTDSFGPASVTVLDSESVEKLLEK